MSAGTQASGGKGGIPPTQEIRREPRTGLFHIAGGLAVDGRNLFETRTSCYERFNASLVMSRDYGNVGFQPALSLVISKVNGSVGLLPALSPVITKVNGSVGL